MGLLCPKSPKVGFETAKYQIKKWLFFNQEHMQLWIILISLRLWNLVRDYSIQLSENSYKWTGQEHFGPNTISQIIPKYGICTGTSQINKFSLWNKFRKINIQNVSKNLNNPILVHFPHFWGERFFQTCYSAMHNFILVSKTMPKCREN